MQKIDVLTVQDISCVGQCSLTVALPIISACGVEAAILPSAVLSTHTGGFTGFTFRDLSDDIPSIRDHWVKTGIVFGSIYTGYLGSAKQIESVLSIADACLEDGGKLIVDPAMADNGKLYPGFDMAYVNEMKKLCSAADVLLPNLTEAALLTGLDYRAQGYDEGYIRALCEALSALGAKTIVLTGVSYSADKLGVAVYENGAFSYYFHERLPGGSHGTGDVYASSFVGSLARGKGIGDAARIAADYTLECIRITKSDETHWYGVKFEKAIPKLLAALNEE